MYVTGSVNNLGDLLSAIRAACTANGWTLSGSVLHKGAIHILTAVVGSTVTFQGGTGIDGSNNLTGAGPQLVRIRAFAQALTFPMTYEVHILTDPDEVYVVVNYSVDFYQWAAWGQSTVAGLPGTGVWYGATQTGGNNPTAIDLNISLGTTVFGDCLPVLLGAANSSGNAANQNGFVQHGLDGESWNPAISGNSGGTNGCLNGLSSLAPLLQILPSTWNNETILLPIKAWRERSSGRKLSLIADLAYARYCRIDFHDPGDIITLGSDQWKVYPWYRKDIVTRNGAFGTQHTGTLGLAVRYTGP